MYVCLYVCVYVRTYVTFPAIIQIFFRVTLNVLVRNSGGTRTPVCQSLLYSIVTTKAVALSCTYSHIHFPIAQRFTYNLFITLISILLLKQLL